MSIVQHASGYTASMKKWSKDDLAQYTIGNWQEIVDAYARQCGCLGIHHEVVVNPSQRPTDGYEALTFQHLLWLIWRGLWAE